MKFFVAFSALFIAANAVPFLRQLNEPFAGKTWVLLCASANGWENYGMEADVYHAYQVIKAHGIPDENIVVMHYDDIAQHPNNPDKGIVVNRVGGPDVYKGVPKHYIGKEVTPQNFLKVLQGDATLKAQGKKVIESGPNDRVFVYLDDHGADEIVAFPNGDLLHAKDLNQAFKDMNTKKQFNHLVFYLAACEAGSMFAKLLPNDINVYAVSATKPDELGWKANSEWKKYNTWLAVYFAVTWLENSETADLTKESVETQFQYIKERNNFTMDGELHWQHAQEYGDLTIANKAHVSEYMGDKKVQFDAATVAPTGFSLSRDAAINIVRKQIENTDDFAAKQQHVDKLTAMLSRRELLDNQIVEYVNTLPGIDANVVLNERLELNNRECYIKLVDTFSHNCYNIGENTYSLYKMKTLVNICETTETEVAVNHLIKYCDSIEKPIEKIL